MTNKRFGLLSVLVLTPILQAQFDPEGAQVLSYFPQFVDGGPAGQQWITSLTLVNPDRLYSVAGIVNFNRDDGSPLALDFGSGAVSSFTFTIPPQGIVSFKTTGASATTVIGWARVASSLPVQGVIQFRYAVNGVPQQGVSAEATEASGLFRSPATPATGIAVANPSSTSLPVNVVLLDATGNTVASSTITLNGFGHKSFTVGQMFPTVPATFHGTVLIGYGAPRIFATYCVAWTLSTDLGVLASYPTSGLNWPVSQYERILKVWWKILNVAVATFPLGNLPTLVVDYSTGQINSFANATLNEVHIFMNLAELISDSESELGFVVGHEIGHIIQARINRLQFVPSNREQDADQYGMLLSLVAGYDPYGAAGALAKLSMASGDASLLDQAFDNLFETVGLDLHGSFNNRLSLIFLNMQSICASPQYHSFCATYKSVIHPHLPAFAPF